jgi:cell division septum initiation protein DivIVA
MFRVAVLGRLAVVLIAVAGLAWLLQGLDSASTTEHSKEVLTTPDDPAPLPAGSSGPLPLKVDDLATATGESSEEVAARAAPDDPAAVRTQEIATKLARKRAERADLRSKKRAERDKRRAKVLKRSARARAEFERRERERGKTAPLVSADSPASPRK